MKYFKLIILIIISSSFIKMFGQDIPNKNEMKKLFAEKYKSKKNIYNDIFYSEFSEESYLKNDTIVLLENSFGFEKLIPEQIIWKFNSKKSLNVAVYDCQNEPPTITYSPKNIRLETKFRNDKYGLNLLLTKNGITIDKFRILSLEYLDDDDRKLTLLRIK